MRRAVLPVLSFATLMLAMQPVAAQNESRPSLKVIEAQQKAAAAPVAAAAPAAPSQDEAVQLAKQAEAYLRNLRTMKARFTQTSNNGQQVGGDFMLKRPGRMRFNYDAPITDFIVADGTFIYFYDGKMKQQSNALISKSLADFFLRRDLSFDGDLKVSDIKRDGGLLQITLVQSTDPLAGALTLGLSENPMILRGWRIVDGQGLVTDVVLSQIQEGITLENEQFRYYDPSNRKSKLN